MSTQMQVIPEGYRQNAQGHLVPIDKIQDIDLERDDLVVKIAEQAVKTNLALVEERSGNLADVQAFIDLSAEQYGVTLGGQKGNVSLTSFDGKYKVKRTIQDNITFDERLQAAKALIDDCIHGWTENSNSNVQALIEHAFQVDKEGKISTGRVLSLRKLKIDDPKWKMAMDAISDSLTVLSKKAYIRVYVRDDDGKYQHLSRDIAGA